MSDERFSARFVFRVHLDHQTVGRKKLGRSELGRRFEVEDDTGDTGARFGNANLADEAVADGKGADAFLARRGR